MPLFGERINMRADQLKEGDKIVMEVAEAGPVLGAKDAWCISFKPPSWRRDFVQNAGGHICVNPEDEFDTPNAPPHLREEKSHE